MKVVNFFWQHSVKYSVVAVLLLAMVAWRLNHIYLNSPREHHPINSQNCYYEDECLFNRAWKLGLLQENNGQLFFQSGAC